VKPNRFGKSIDDLEVLYELSDDEFPVRYKKFYIDRCEDEDCYKVYSKMEWESRDIERVPEAELPDIDSLTEFIESIEDVSDFDDVVEATTVGGIGQHKRCSIDLIPNVPEEDEQPIKESKDYVNTYVYVSEIRKAIENQNWKKDEYPLFEQQAEYLRDWLDSAGFAKSNDGPDEVYISPDDKFYVTITDDGKFIRFNDTDETMEESPNITELEPNLPSSNAKDEVPEDDEEDDGVEDVEIPDDAGEELLLEVDMLEDDEEDKPEDAEEEPEEKELKKDKDGFVSDEDLDDIEDKPDEEEEPKGDGELSKSQNQLLQDLANAVESTTPLEDMEYYILKYVDDKDQSDISLPLELAPILYKAMNDDEDPNTTYEELSKKINAYAKRNGLI